VGRCPAPSAVYHAGFVDFNRFNHLNNETVSTWQDVPPGIFKFSLLPLGLLLEGHRIHMIFANLAHFDSVIPPGPESRAVWGESANLATCYDLLPATGAKRVR